MDNSTIWLNSLIDLKLDDQVEKIVDGIVSNVGYYDDDDETFFGRWLDAYTLLEEVMSKE